MRNYKKVLSKVLMEPAVQCHRLVTVKEIGKAPVIPVWIGNFLKENNLMTVEDIFIISDPSDITEYRRKFKNLLLIL